MGSYNRLGMATLSVLKEREGVFNKIKSKKKVREPLGLNTSFFFLRMVFLGVSGQWVCSLSVMMRAQPKSVRLSLRDK